MSYIDEHFFAGVIVGMLLVYLLWYFSRQAQLHTLVMIGDANGNEKILGNWYQIRRVQTEKEARDSNHYHQLKSYLDSLVVIGSIEDYELTYNPATGDWDSTVNPIQPPESICVKNIISGESA